MAPFPLEGEGGDKGEIKRRPQLFTLTMASPFKGKGDENAGEKRLFTFCSMSSGG